MTVLKILQYPDPRLRKKAQPVSDFGEATQKVIQDLFDTMYSISNSAGLAATQVDIQQRIVVIDFSPEKNKPVCLINPEIIESSEEITHESEGCLSVPVEVSDPIKRNKEVKFRAFNEKGESFEVDADGFLAKCIQHEIDHLDGKLFIDHLSSLKRARVDKQIRELQRQRAKQKEE